MRRICIGAGIVLLLCFAVLSKYEDRSQLRALDVAVTVKMQERIDSSSHLRAASLVANIMEGATFFAGPEFTVVGTLIITALVLYDRKKRRWRLSAFAIPLALIVIVIVEIYAKSMVHHPSPEFSMIKNPTSIFPANYINEQFSYPSGHAARAVFLGIMFFSLMKGAEGKVKRLGITLSVLGYILIVSMSRVYLGHHWFSDVLGGLLLGSGCSCMGIALLSRRSI